MGIPNSCYKMSRKTNKENWNVETEIFQEEKFEVGATVGQRLLIPISGVVWHTTLTPWQGPPLWHTDKNCHSDTLARTATHFSFTVSLTAHADTLFSDTLYTLCSSNFDLLWCNKLWKPVMDFSFLTKVRIGEHSNKNIKFQKPGTTCC